MEKARYSQEENQNELKIEFAAENVEMVDLSSGNAEQVLEKDHQDRYG
jgi:hypothetical protein